jgi:hypothetical protein
MMLIPKETAQIIRIVLLKNDLKVNHKVHNKSGLTDRVKILHQLKIEISMAIDHKICQVYREQNIATEGEQVCEKCKEIFYRE